MPSLAPANRGRVILAAVCLTGLLACSRVGAEEKLDLDAWRRMPVLVRGRLQPLDSYARDTVEAICGRPSPTLLLADGTSRTFSAAELLLEWLVEPDAWRDVAFLEAEHEQLRSDILKLPVFDAQGNRLKHASLPQLDAAKGFSARQDELAKLAREARQDDDAFQPAGMDRKLFALAEARAKYRELIYRPSGAVDGAGRTFQTLAEAVTNWRNVGTGLRTLLSLDAMRSAAPAAEKIDETVGRIVDLVSKDQLTVANADPLLQALREASGQLAERFDDLLRKLYRDPAAVLPGAKELRPEQMRVLRSQVKIIATRIGRMARLTKIAQLALYDNGGALFVIPALEPEALQAERLDNDAQPWLSLQVVLYGSDRLLAGYPQTEIKAARDAWKAMSAAYLERKNPERPARFRSEMERFVAAMRALGEALEPLREKLPIGDADRGLLAATRYPPPAATRAELHYNVFNPFLWACVVNIAATCCLALAFGPIRKWGFWIGMAVLVAGQIVTGYGFGLRTCITGWAPVTGMFEMVMFTGFVTAVLAVWFVLLPLVWPGMSTAWRMSAFPLPHRSPPLESVAKVLSLVVRLPLMVLTVYLLAWLPYGEGHRALLSLTPRTDVGTSLPSGMELVTWLVGMCVLVLTAWYVPRAAVAALWSLVAVPVQWWKQGISRAVEHTLARHWIALMGAVMAALIASIAYWSPLWDQGIDTLRPVLRDRFWLYLHVLTITASYGAGALALGLANVSMFFYLFGRYWAPSMSLQSLAALGHRPAGPAPAAAHLRRAPEVCDVLAGYIYKILQVAVVLLAVGTILGGLWADVAWGRFWGWDPKEVWALISLLIYLVILHGRYAGWAGHFGLVAGSVFGAAGIVVASWGVNYFWAGAGLHSYASGEGGNLYVLLFLIFEILFLAAAAVRYWLAMRTRAA